MADGIIETRAAKCSDEFGDIDFLNNECATVDHKALRQAEKDEPGLEAKFNRCVSCAMEVLKHEIGINPIRVADEVCYKTVVKPFGADKTDFEKIFNPSSMDDLFKPPSPDNKKQDGKINPDDLLKPPSSNFGTSF